MISDYDIILLMYNYTIYNNYMITWRVSTFDPYMQIQQVWTQVWIKQGLFYEYKHGALITWLDQGT